MRFRVEDDSYSLLKRSASILLLVVSLCLASAPVQAGENKWTGGAILGDPPGDPLGPVLNLVTLDRKNPGWAYAGNVGTVALFRTKDAGRSWQSTTLLPGPLASIFVDDSPLDQSVPSTLFAGLLGSEGLWTSGDAGLSWATTTLTGAITLSFAASQSTSKLYAGAANGSVFGSNDSGRTWQSLGSLSQTLTKSIASLVIDPTNDSTLYAGGYASFDYPTDNPVLAKSADGGMTWSDLTTAQGFVHHAVGGLQFVGNALFVSLMGDPGVLSSVDGGSSWIAANRGLPAGIAVNGLAYDNVSGVLYAATSAGIYRNLESPSVRGEPFVGTWQAFSQQLAGVNVSAIAVDNGSLHVATSQGAFDLEFVDGPVDISSGSAGTDRVLSWHQDQLSIATLDTSGNNTTTAVEGPYDGWTATAIADGPDGLWVLWQHGEGRVSLEVFPPTGPSEVFRLGAEPGWTATDISQGANGRPHVLWVSADGRMLIHGIHQFSVPVYGPYAGWSAVAMSDGPDGATWVLWRRSDGLTGVARYRDSVFEVAFRGELPPGWTSDDIAVGSDALPRILETTPDGTMAISTVDATGAFLMSTSYSNPGFTPRRIAASPDGLTRVLWSKPGTGEIWLFNPDNTFASKRLGFP